MSNLSSPSQAAALGAATSTAPAGQASRKQLWLRANAQHTSLYFRQMHALLHAGASLTVALDEMSRSAPNRGLRSASSEMGRRVAAGELWSHVMRDYPGLFSELAVALISVGETGGSLEHTCRKLSEFAENEYHIQQIIKRETWYPKLLLLFSTIFPISLPLGGHTYVLGCHTQLLLIAIAWSLWKFLNFAWPVCAHTGRPRYLLDRIKLKAPFASTTVRSLAIVKFCRSLGLLYAAGLGLPRAVSMAADACGNAVIADNIRRITPRLQRGETLTAALAATSEFPGSTLQMTHMGETSGSLDEMMQKVADLLEAEAQTALHEAVVAFNLMVFLLVAFKIAVQIVQAYC